LADAHKQQRQFLMLLGKDLKKKEVSKFVGSRLFMPYVKPQEWLTTSCRIVGKALYLKV
jgi:hypothetical protein